jgi:hypothetical protein
MTDLDLALRNYRRSKSIALVCSTLFAATLTMIAVIGMVM